MDSNVVSEVTEEISTPPAYNCNACGEVITSNTNIQKLNCGHTFHSACLAKCVKTRPFCPICNARISNEPPTPSTSQRTTRSQSKLVHVNTSNADRNTVPSTNSLSGTEPGADLNQDRLQALITNIVSAQQEQFYSSLSTQLSQIIEKSIDARFSRLQVQNTSVPQVQPLNTSPHHIQTLPDVESRTFRELFGAVANPEHTNNTQSRPNIVNGHSALNMSGIGTSSSDLNSRPDKVLQIMSNWKLKFNGGQNGLSVENFIYRVEVLTVQTLQGNYDLLCGNASSLFEGKASDWFWRYHRSVEVISWSQLCRALRQQYQDSRTDVDIRELIRDRKQKQNESFDSFYDSIVSLTDRLKEPLSDETLVEILRRNLLPEIQHELLNIEVKSLQFLRDSCRRREFFLQDMRRRHCFPSSKPIPITKRVSEIGQDIIEEDTEIEIFPNEVSAISLICWNCRKHGHRYHDCLSERTIFCYGCGAPDTFKPNCTKCNSKNGRLSAQKSALNQPKTSVADLE